MSTTTPSVDADLIGTVEQFFNRKSDHAAVSQAEADGRADDLWTATEHLGLPLVGIDEDAGGSGGTVLDLLAVLRIAASQAAPLPLAETHLAAWLLASAGLDIPTGPMTIVPGAPDDSLRLVDGRLTGTAHDVPFAGAVETVVALVDGRVVAASADQLEFSDQRDLAGQPRGNVTFDVPVALDAESPVTADDLLLRGALVRSAQIAGALEATSKLTREYVGQRVQFGRPVGSFQAVQQHVVTLAQGAAMTSLAVTRAAVATLVGDGSFEICSLKLVANQNAIAGVRAAHQAHGAIGMTQEYRLQQLTRRLNTWLLEFGTERQLATRVGAFVAGSNSFAATITAADGTVEVRHEQ